MRALTGETAARFRFRATTTKALAHPARLFMLETLAGGERCVCELREMVGLDLSTVSKHLALLRGAGLVTDERRGTQVFYRLPALRSDGARADRGRAPEAARLKRLPEGAEHGRRRWPNASD